MINSTRVGRHVIALVFGVMAATIVASVVGPVSRVAAIIVFGTIVLVWVGFAVLFARCQVEARGGRLGAFANPQQWTAEALPLEFRFITHETPMHQVIDKIGPPSKRPPIPRGAIRYDWPDGRIICVYAEFLATRSGHVNAIQIYNEPSDIPIDEII
jgi:hypothetical protein